MGQLRTSITNAGTVLKSVEKAAAKAINDLDTFASNVQMWSKGGGACVDEMYLYVSEKLKKLGLDFNAEQRKTLAEFKDSALQKYLTANEDCVNTAADFSAKFQNLCGGLDGDLQRLEDAYNDIAAKIKKKRKKLFQSKKFKNKMDVYETAVEELVTKTNKVAQALQELRAHTPPKPARLQTYKVTEATTLVQLKAATSRKFDAEFAEYKKLCEAVQLTRQELRIKENFEGYVKHVRAMLEDADEMEAEAEN